MRCAECVWHRQIAGGGLCFVNPTYENYYPIGNPTDGRKKACGFAISKQLSWQEVNAEIARRININPHWNKG